MADPGLMFACFGCCCGHTNNGAARFARPALRRQYDAAGLQGFNQRIPTVDHQGE